MPEEQKKRKLTHHESTPVEYASLPLRGFNGARERPKTRKKSYGFHGLNDFNGFDDFNGSPRL
jgi:hypothetical protein